MKILAATRDDQTAAAIFAAMRLRWPTSGEVVVVSQLDDKIQGSLSGFDLFIVDSGLGCSTARIKKLCDNLPGIPLLYIADPHGDQLDTASAILSLGTADYLFKPLEIGELISMIEAITTSSKPFFCPMSLSQIDTEKEINN